MGGNISAEKKTFFTVYLFLCGGIFFGQSPSEAYLPCPPEQLIPRKAGEESAAFICSLTFSLHLGSKAETVDCVHSRGSGMSEASTPGLH